MPLTLQTGKHKQSGKSQVLTQWFRTVQGRRRPDYENVTIIVKN